MKRVAVFLILVAFSIGSGYSGSGLALKNDVRNFIVNLANYIVSIHPSTGTLGGTGGSEGFVYVHGCYVITLVSAYEITGDTSYINEARRWCRWFIGQQIVYDGGDKGYWGDHGSSGPSYLADTQKGAYALLRTYAHADSALQADILIALRRFANRIKTGGFIVSPYFYGGSLNVYGDGSGDG
jgi:rhamnogalacturonyl hydrolase YesR